MVYQNHTGALGDAPYTISITNIQLRFGKIVRPMLNRSPKIETKVYVKIHSFKSTLTQSVVAIGTKMVY